MKLDYLLLPAQQKYSYSKTKFPIYTQSLTLYEHNLPVKSISHWVSTIFAVAPSRLFVDLHHTMPFQYLQNLFY